MSDLVEHESCSWRQIGLCVYCADHGVRLYQGDLPDRKRTTPRCASGEHEWDPEMGQGYYLICEKCGVKEWLDD